jgi:DNA primase
LARIPESFVQQLLAQLDIVECVQSRVPLKRAGQNWSARCPFHQEKTPSFSVSSTKQFYHCFGCGAHGDAIRFVMEMDGLSFPDAVEKLAAQVGLSVPQGAVKAANPVELDLYALLERAAAWFVTQLQAPHATEAQQYCAQRGLDAAAMEYFQIGAAPAAWDGLIKHFGGSDKAPLTLLEQAGLIIRHDSGRYYDRFRERVMFPIRDRKGRVIAFGGRALGEVKPKYLNSPETPVFHKRSCLYGVHEALKQRRAWRKAVVVEGYMDVIALSTNGIKGAFASLGTALTEQHLHSLFALSAEVLFCFDADAAGRKAAWSTAQSLLPFMEGDRQASFLFLPNGEDPDSYIRNFGPKAFRHAAKSAYPLSTFIFETLKQQYSPDSIDSKARYVTAAQKLIRELPSGVYKQLMEKALNDFAFGDRKRRKGSNRTLSVDPAPRPALRQLTEMAMVLLLEQPKLANFIPDGRWIEQIETPQAKVLARLIERIHAEPQTSPEVFAAALKNQVPALGSMPHLVSLEPSAQETEFLGIVERLAWMGKQQLADKLIGQSKTKEGLSEAQKHQLKALLGSLEKQSLNKN